MHEEPPGIEPRPHPERTGRRVHHLEGGPQQAVLVVAAHHRQATGQQDLAPVPGDVDVVEGDAVAVGGLLGPRDDGLEGLGHGPAAGRRVQGVDAPELDEGDRGMAVLGRLAPAEEAMADGRRQEAARGR